MNWTSRIQNLHNKTQELAEEELPYNPKNILLNEDTLRKMLDEHGLKNIPFRNINLYRTAFVHKSYCTMKNDDFESGNERCPDDCLPLQDQSYERLEFLGDAILGCVVALYLFMRFPAEKEGFLSNMRTKIVNGKSLGEIGRKMGFTPFVIISKQIEESQGRNNYKVLEDVFESFIAALFIDSDPNPDKWLSFNGPLKNLEPDILFGNGFHVASTFIVNVIEKYFDFSELIVTKTNYKHQLQTYMQQAMHSSPKYFEVRIDVHKGQKVFVYCVKDSNGTVLGTGKGPTKKDAENIAAHEALLRMGQTPTD